MAAVDLTAEIVREFLDYDTETGVFTWRERSIKWFTNEARRAGWNTRLAGKRAGTISPRGYVFIDILNHPRRAHIVAWVWMTGEIPAQPIDHIDGNGLNNAWSNLRQVTHSTNMQNLRKPKSSNTLGVLGVCRSRGRFVARIVVNGTGSHIGVFKTIDEAKDAYLQAKRRLHQGCTI